VFNLHALLGMLVTSKCVYVWELIHDNDINIINDGLYTVQASHLKTITSFLEHVTNTK